MSFTAEHVDLELCWLRQSNESSISTFYEWLAYIDLFLHKLYEPHLYIVVWPGPMDDLLSSYKPVVLYNPLILQVRTRLFGCSTVHIYTRLYTPYIHFWRRADKQAIFKRIF